MSRSLRILVPLFVLIALFGVSFKPAEAQGKNNAPGYIVVLNRSMIGANKTPYGQVLKTMKDLYGIQVTHEYRHALKGFAAEIPADKLALLQADPFVSYVEANQVWSITQSQTTPTGITRSYAASNSTLKINGVADGRVDVDVAVIDSGVYAHPDLNLVQHMDCASGSPLRGSCKRGGTDGNGHGTHVAGTIGAYDNGIGVVGVAPGARIHGVRVLGNNGSGYTSWIIAGIDWVTANASTIEVANMSLGCECYSKAQDDAITRSINAGVVYVVAAGNSAKDASTFSPANHPLVLTVSALADFNGLPGGGAASTCRVDQDDTLADFSNYGSTVEVAAPGVCINSTWNNGGYNSISGTSMASPHAAGVAAILASRPAQYPTNNLTDVNRIKNAIINSGNFGWTDDKDGNEEPLIDVSNTTIFNAALTGQ